MKRLKRMVVNTAADCLSNIYKANQCTDSNDYKFAIEQCLELRKVFGVDNKSIMRRVVSLKSKAVNKGWI